MSDRRALFGNAFVWMAMAQVGFALMNVCARSSHPYAPWAEVAVARSSIGGLVAFLVARSRGVTIVVQDQKKAWLRSIAGTGSVLMTFYVLGAPQIDVGDVAAIGATTPIIIALLAPLIIREKAQARVWICALIAFSGVVVITQPKLATAAHLVLIMLGAATSAALAQIVLRRMGPNESPESVALHFSVVTSVAMILISIPSFELPRGIGILWMLATGLAGGLAQIAQTRAYALEEAAKVGVFSYVGVVLTQALAALILDEALGVHQIVGSLSVICAGVILARASIARRPNSEVSKKRAA